MDPQNFKSGHSTYRLSTPNLTFFLVGTGVWVQSFALLSRHANIWAMPLNLKFEKLQNMDYFECVHDTTCGNSTLVLMWWVIVEMQVHWWFFKIKLINEFCLNLASSPRYLKYSRIKKKKKKGKSQIQNICGPKHFPCKFFYNHKKYRQKSTLRCLKNYFIKMVNSIISIFHSTVARRNSSKLSTLTLLFLMTEYIPCCRCAIIFIYSGGVLYNHSANLYHVICSDLF
jgi:hypothetical protein